MDELFAVLSKKGDEFLNGMKQMLINKIQKLSFEDLMQYLKETASLEEMKMDELSFKKCIELVKSGWKNECYGGCVLKSQSEDADYTHKMVICFVDKNNEPLLNGKAKWWIVYTKRLSQDLSDQFGDKSMIILK